MTTPFDLEVGSILSAGIEKDLYDEFARRLCDLANEVVNEKSPTVGDARTMLTVLISIASGCVSLATTMAQDASGDIETQKGIDAVLRMAAAAFISEESGIQECFDA